MLKFLAESKVSNPIVLTGDIHSNWVNDLQVDCDDPDSPVVATEFVGTSITFRRRRLAPSGKDTAGVLAENPFVKFYNKRTGLRVVRCDAGAMDVALPRGRHMFPGPGAPLVTRQSFVVENGHPALQLG